MSEIKPALTAEEWSELRAGWAQIHDGEDDFIDGEVVWVPVADPSVRITHCEHEFRGKDRHALAALALHDQQFGFTWEDVDALTEVVGSYEDNAAGGHGSYDLDALELAKLAIKKLSALLPPRES